MANSALKRQSKTLLATASASGDQYIVFNNLTTDYCLYEIVCENIDFSGDNFYLARVYTDNGTTPISASGSYDWSGRVYGATSTQTGQIDSTSSTLMMLFSNDTSGSAGGAGTNELLSGSLYVYDPMDSGEYTQITSDFSGAYSDGNHLYGKFGGRRLNAEANNAIGLVPSTGVHTTGEFHLYGYKDAT